MSFSATKLVSSFKIYISNDEVAESTEEFFLDLEIPSSAVAAGAIKGSPDNVTVSIANDDGECCFSAPYSSEHIVHSINVCLNYWPCDISFPKLVSLSKEYGLY